MRSALPLLAAASFALTAGRASAGRGGWRMTRLARIGVTWGLALAVAACGRNPVLGEWELDRGDNPPGTVLAADAAELATLRFERGKIDAGGTVIPVKYEIEGDVVRAVRDDGRGEHRVEVLPDGRLRVELPIGVAAIYRPAG
jgi:hypothetical protein